MESGHFGFSLSLEPVAVEQMNLARVCAQQPFCLKTAQVAGYHFSDRAEPEANS